MGLWLASECKEKLHVFFCKWNKWRVDRHSFKQSSFVVQRKQQASSWRISIFISVDIRDEHSSELWNVFLQKQHDSFKGWHSMFWKTETVGVLALGHSDWLAKAVVLTCICFLSNKCWVFSALICTSMWLSLNGSYPYFDADNIH